MIKSFKWLALDSDIESAKEFVDTLPIPQEGEENMSVEELMELRKQNHGKVKKEKKKDGEKIRLKDKLFKKKAAKETEKTEEN